MIAYTQRISDATTATTPISELQVCLDINTCRVTLKNKLSEP